MIRILDNVDLQGDFMQETGILYVPNAEALIDRTNDFYRQIPAGGFQYGLFKYDSHFADEYRHSPESQFFPLHCEYDTPGWHLVVDPDLLAGKMDVRFMTKNTFDMWDANPLPKGQVLSFKNESERLAYDNLHRVTTDRMAIAPGILRDQFMKSIGLGAQPVKVTLLGVASNFCDDDAMFGYLEAGADVEVIEDLVAGLVTTVPGRAASGDIRDVIALPRYKQYVDSGKLTLTTSDRVLRSLQP